jgi:Ser/Thr protein kinase RdoA (MazF antagonist)
MDVGPAGARAVGVALVGEPLAGSMSSSVVHRAVLDGKEVVLKATGADAQQELARRELAFYRTLADGLPVRTPRLLRYVDTDELTALVLSAHAPAPPAAEWVLEEWLRAARELAALHSAPVPAGPLWEHQPWVRWALAHGRRELAEAFWTEDPVRRVLGDIEAIAAALDALDDCFVHGDCHADNLLRDGADLVWSDWQVTGRGSAAGDLAFLWSRAHADGAEPPYEQMVEAYLAVRDCDAEVFRRALVAAELSTGLFGWPEYLGYHTPDEQVRIRARVATLATRWLCLRG